MAVVQQQHKASPFTPAPPFQTLQQQQAPQSSAAPLPPGHTDTSGGTPAPAAQNTATMPNGTTLNFADDPILAKVQALNQKMISDAQSQALAEKQRELIDFGDPNLVKQILGHDSVTAKAAGQNPFSTLAQLLTGHQSNTRTIDTTRNAENLWYSSTRGYDLTNEGKAYLLRQALAQNQLEAGIRAQDQMVLAAQQAASEREIMAEEAAYSRALQMYLQSLGTGITSPGTGSGGQSAPPGSGPPASQAPAAPPAAPPGYNTNVPPGVFPLFPAPPSHYGPAPAPNYYL